MKHHCLLIVWLIANLASSAHAFDLMAAWHAASQYDASFAASRSELDAGKEKQAQGLAQLLPQVTMAAGYSYQHSLTSSALLTKGSTAGLPIGNYSVTVSQPLFDVPRFIAYRKGQIETKLAETQFAIATQQLMIDVAKNYFDVLLAQDTLAAIQAAKKAYQTQLEQARLAFELGTTTITDTYEAQAEYDSAVAKEIEAQNTLAIHQSTLTRLTGLSASAIQPLSDTLRLEPPHPAILSTWTELAIVHNGTVQQQQQRVAIATQELAEKQARHLPVVSLTASYQGNHYHTPAWMNSSSSQNSIGIQLSLPLFSGGSINAHIREATARLASARDQLESSHRMVREKVYRSYLGVINGAALVNARQQRLITAKAKLDATRLAKEVGVRSQIDLLTAQKDYTDTVKSLAEARYRYLTAHLELAHSTGKLDESVLAQINASVQHG